MNIAAIFAGGVGSRMNLSPLPKQFLEIHGRPVIVHTLQRFQDSPRIDAIGVAILPEYRDRLRDLVDRHRLDKVRWIIDGGATGQESRHRLLSRINAEAEGESIVLLHDGVRPLIDSDLIARTIDAVEQHGAAVTCTKVSETIVVAPEDEVEQVIPREKLWTAQAPQGFRLHGILEAYEKAIASGSYDSIDSCSLMRAEGHYVHKVEGPVTNIKITTASDYYVCRAFFDLVENRQLGGAGL